MQKFKETEDSWYIYQEQLDKFCFQHDLAYADFKDLTRRMVSDRILHDEAFNIAINPKYVGYQRGLSSMVCKCFDKKTFGSDIKNENISNKELAEKLNKPIIRKSNKSKARSTFIDNVWGW